ncbi:MAG: cystathionine gamma-synthase family protein [Elusimicrobiota bacterium]
MKHGNSKKNLTAHPESLMMSYGYKPELSEGALKCPIFQTSTFVFKNAREGKAFFQIVYGLRVKGPTEELGLIYSRLNNPDLEILENRLCLWDGAEDCAVFSSGMSAISTTLLEFLKPGDCVLYSEPLYGGTDYLFRHVLPKFGIKAVGFAANSSSEQLRRVVESFSHGGRLAAIFLETPANPTNAVVDIEACARLARSASTKDRGVLVIVDNTFLGPLWQRPLRQGADLIIYSATKFIGGHSDVIAGACLGSKVLMSRVRTLRTFLGTMADPWAGWLLLRSLETLKLRMTCQMENARLVARFLSRHSSVERVYYMDLLRKTDPQHKIYRKQCLGPGSVISFDIKGGERQAFRFLDRLKLFKLAVSLGGTESLCEHPSTMTHADIDPASQRRMGITHKMVRLSIGVENSHDLIADLRQALE